jgi:hypothetical protein
MEKLKKIRRGDYVVILKIDPYRFSTKKFINKVFKVTSINQSFPHDDVYYINKVCGFYLSEIMPASKITARFYGKTKLV